MQISKAPREQEKHHPHMPGLHCLNSTLSIFNTLSFQLHLPETGIMCSAKLIEFTSAKLTSLLTNHMVLVTFGDCQCWTCPNWLFNKTADGIMVFAKSLMRSPVTSSGFRVIWLWWSTLSTSYCFYNKRELHIIDTRVLSVQWSPILHMPAIREKKSFRSSQTQGGLLLKPS